MFSLNNLRIKHSVQITGAALIVLISGLWVLYSTAISFYLFMGMCAVGCLGTSHFILKHGLVALPNSIICCDATPNALYFTQRNGIRIKAIPIAGSYMSERLLLLTWQPNQQKSRWHGLFTPANLVILSKDNVSSLEDFRRLRVLLTFSKPKQS